MTHDQNLDSNFWVMLITLIERSPVRRLQSGFIRDGSGQLQVVTSMLQASTICQYFNASGNEDLVTPGIHDRHHNVVPDESFKTTSWPKLLWGFSGDYVGLSLFASLLNSLQLHGFHL